MYFSRLSCSILQKINTQIIEKWWLVHCIPIQFRISILWFFMHLQTKCKQLSPLWFVIFLKFKFSKKASEILQRFPIQFEVYLTDNKSTARFCQIFEVFLENLNFTYVEFKKVKNYFKHVLSFNIFRPVGLFFYLSWLFICLFVFNSLFTPESWFTNGSEVLSYLPKGFWHSQHIFTYFRMLNIGIFNELLSSMLCELICKIFQLLLVP